MDFDEILCDQHMKFSRTFQQSHGPWWMLVKISIFLYIFRKNEWILIKVSLCIDIYVVTNTHYFPGFFQQSYDPWLFF